MNCNYLGKILRQWFDESSDYTQEKNFSFRFRGKESFNYLQHFSSLIGELSSKIQSQEDRLCLFQIFYQSLILHKLVSYSVRIENITANEILEMALFKSCCLYDTHVSPSMWVFCNIAPSHCKQLFATLGVGLDIDTMEGREQKHQMVDKYSQNSTFQERWKFIFRHEFTQLIYLREHGFDNKIPVAFS